MRPVILSPARAPVGVSRQPEGAWQRCSQSCRASRSIHHTGRIALSAAIGAHQPLVWRREQQHHGAQPQAGSGAAAGAAASRQAGCPRRSAIVVHASYAAGGSADGPGPSAFEQASTIRQVFWKFLRPHTIRGTVLGTTAVVCKALIENPQAIDWGLLPRALLGLLALLCGNGYIVGINQIYDVDIDVVNKPFLPIAAGELSLPLAWTLVVGLAAGGLSLVAANFGPLITRLYALGLILGTVYSIPPLRLKRFAVPAFIIIATVRGFLLNFGVYHATRAALGLPFVWSPAIGFITGFVTVFATVIAVTKDMPDIEGDQANNIQTFSTRLGVKRVGQLAVALLMLNYVGAVALALALPGSFNVPVMVGAHVVLGIVLAYQGYKLSADRHSKEAVASFYRWIWNLFYSEYALLVLM